MKRVFALAVVLTLVAPLSIFAVEQEAKTQEQQKMEAYMKYAMPNENHKYFEQFVGTWEVKSKMWFQPGSEPTVTTVTAEGKMILGGRYLHLAFEGPMMGQLFKGIQITGYDNFINEYRTFWIDNMGTSFYETSGTLDESGKIMTQTGVWPGMAPGEKQKVKMVTKPISKDKFIFEMYMILPDGSEFKSIENISTRKK
jgi:hypothetical protein